MVSSELVPSKIVEILAAGPSPVLESAVLEPMLALQELLDECGFSFRVDPAEPEKFRVVGAGGLFLVFEGTLRPAPGVPHRFSFPIEPFFRRLEINLGCEWSYAVSDYYGPRILSEIRRVVHALLLEGRDGWALPVSPVDSAAEAMPPEVTGATKPDESAAPVLERKVELLRQIDHFSTALFSLIAAQTSVRLSWDEVLQQWQNYRTNVESGTSGGALGLYVHVPVCTHECTYCQIPVRLLQNKTEIEGFLDALQFELGQYAQVMRGAPVRAMSIGGGTPNLLSAAQTVRMLDSIFKVFTVDPRFHVTVDLSPAATSKEKLKAWRQFGASRVVFGVQSLDPVILHRVNRPGQNEATLRKAISLAHEIGFESIGVDLIAGLPGDTVEGFLRTLETTVDIRPHHIQIFRWILEPKCREFELHGPMTPSEIEERERIVQAAYDYMEGGARQQLYSGHAANYGLEYMDRNVDLFHMTSHYEMLRSAQSSILALGRGGVSRIQGAMEYSSVLNWPEYLSWPHRDLELPFQGSPMSREFAMASFWASNLDGGFMSRRRFRREFGATPEQAFPHDIAFLLRKGWLKLKGDMYTVPEGIGRQEAAIAGTLVFRLDELEGALKRQQRESNSTFSR